MHVTHTGACGVKKIWAGGGWRHVQMKCGVNDSFSEPRSAKENSDFAPS